MGDFLRFPTLCQWLANNSVLAFFFFILFLFFRVATQEFSSFFLSLGQVGRRPMNGNFVDDSSLCIRINCFR